MIETTLKTNHVSLNWMQNRSNLYGFTRKHNEPQTSEFFENSEVSVQLYKSKGDLREF
jgi:hypothetical protein